MESFLSYTKGVKMTKADLIKAISEKLTGNTKVSQKIIDEVVAAALEAVSDTVMNEGRFSYPNFGTFTLRERKAREGVNPQDPSKKIQISASKSVGFKPSKGLKEKLNQSF